MDTERAFEYEVKNDGAVINAYNGGAEEVEVPADIDGLPVIAIAASAFQNNKQLRAVTLPDSIDFIANEAFLGCSALSSIRLPKRMNEYGMGIRAFADCASLKKVELPEGINGLGRELFLNCASLEEVALPKSAYIYANRCLAGCSSLRRITLPKVGTITGASFADSPLEPYKAVIDQCQMKAAPFVFENGVGSIGQKAQPAVAQATVAPHAAAAPQATATPRVAATPAVAAQSAHKPAPTVRASQSKSNGSGLGKLIAGIKKLFKG